MKNSTTSLSLATAISAAAALAMPSVRACEQHGKMCTHGHEHQHNHKHPAPDTHAPIGVMADHTHKAGEFMLSYRYGVMSMSGNRDGTTNLSPETIVTTVPNRFAGVPGMPPTLRVVPIEMTMEMHMVGAMWAPSDSFTLMLMGSYFTKEMDHVTFAGGMGTTRRGEFTTRSSGIGDTKIAGLFSLMEEQGHRVHVTFGLSLPTGSITEQAEVLTPMGGRPTPRMPYPMQLGSGTYDLMPALTYAGNSGAWGWGVQYGATLRLGDNDENYRLGNVHKFTAWSSYRVADPVSLSLRAELENEGTINGIDAQIRAPIQTADPDNSGGQRLALFAGLNWSLGNGHRLALEIGDTVHQHLNGPQLQRDETIRLGYQFSWK